jgi:aspartyl-tRNA(Asn)/glutamyl-tRNA(Gln) amidotransferase subunit A
MLSAIAGPDRHDRTAALQPVPDFTAGIDRGIAGLRVGVPEQFFLVDLDPEVEAAMRAAIRQFEALGAELRPVSLPASEFASAASWTIAYTESFVFHHDWFAAKAHDYTPAFYHKIAAAGLTSAVERIVSQQVRQVVTREFMQAFELVDVIVTPTSRTLASADSRAVPPGARTLPWGAEMTSVTRPVSLTGFPALSVPIGFAKDNTPMGMQLVGRPWEEATLFRVGHAYEQSMPWHTARPPAFPAEIPPRFGENAATEFPAEPSATGPVTPGWVMDMARLLGYGFVTEADAEAIAPMLAPVKDQLEAARKTLKLDIEPPTRAAGLAW